jgi:hypothetical protein
MQFGIDLGHKYGRYGCVGTRQVGRIVRIGAGGIFGTAKLYFSAFQTVTLTKSRYEGKCQIRKSSELSMTAWEVISTFLLQS